MTVWRDVKALEEMGLLCRIHGGVRLAGGFTGEPSYEEKGQSAHVAKQRIAALAVREFVREGDTIALEGGTTIAAVVDCLPSSRISILTNSLPVAIHARSVRPECPVQIAGGWLSPVSGNATGPDTLRVMEKWQPSVCFLSATGFDGEVGPSDPNPLEIEVKRVLASKARRVVLLLDSSKFGHRSAAITLHPRRIHALISDAPPLSNIRSLLAKHRIRFLVA